MDIEEAIRELDDGIRRLKVQYDLFFSGANPRPPNELRAQVDRLIRNHANAAIRRYSDRFLFNSLVGRYNAFVELWNKQQRVLEEGRDRPGLPHLFAPPRGAGSAPSEAPAEDPAAPRPPAAPPNGGAEPEREPGTLWSVRIRGAAGPSKELTSLFEQYVEARRRKTGTAPRLSLDSFARQIARQAEALRAASGCEAVEFRLTEADSQVTIKARPAPVPDGRASGNGRTGPDTEADSLDASGAARETVESSRGAGPR